MIASGEADEENAAHGKKGEEGRKGKERKELLCFESRPSH